MPLTDAEKLRILNLAYNQMQADFKRFMPDLFRGTAQALTTDASGYIYLPTTAMEVELLVKTTGNDPIEPMSKELKYLATGWYEDGVQTTGGEAGKRRIMIRNEGAVWASLGVTVDILVEYAELTALSGSGSTPYPFVAQRYRNMLTELQAFMLHMEGGKESAGEAEKHWNVYRFFLEQAKKDALDKRPHFMAIAHADAGDARTNRIVSS